MTVESITCPNCGASIQLQPGQSLVTCVYCNSSLRVSGEQKAPPPPRPMPAPTADPGAPFRMTVEDVFSIRNRGTVVTGRVESGTLRPGDDVLLCRGSSSRKVKVAGVEMFHKIMDQAGPGDNVGVMLKDVDRSAVQPGDVLTAA